MIDNLIKIAVDPVFPAPVNKNAKKVQIPDYSENKFELIFNKMTDGIAMNNINQTEVIIEEDEDDDREDDDEQNDDESDID